MKILLIENVNHVGKRGDTREVSDGYARNFLFPHGYAVIFSIEQEEKLQNELKKNVHTSDIKNIAIGELGAQLKTITLRAHPKKNENGVLFAAYKEHDILRALAERGVKLPNNIRMDGIPIKKIGEHTVHIQLSKNIHTQITIVLT